MSLEQKIQIIVKKFNDGLHSVAIPELGLMESSNVSYIEDFIKRWSHKYNFVVREATKEEIKLKELTNENI